MRCTPYGPTALLFTFAERVGDEAFALGRALVAELERNPPPGLVEHVPAFTTVLLEFDPEAVRDPGALAQELIRRFSELKATAGAPAPIKEIPVSYDGEDLDAVARAHQLTTAEVRELHSAPIYKVYLLGFSPGFPYLGDLDPRLHMPRLATPRPRVRAGSVAIGGEHTGIYSVDSPGGWNVIGHTPLKIFDPLRGHPNGPDEGMFFLKPGDRVTFVPMKAI
ncbi:MAG TPA: 5-oxoprolinase subunit PxpB [Verrucomicrobiae bacterium]|jgi:inhibitor of KinA